MPEIRWKVDSEKISREDAEEILDQVEKQLEEQTGESIQRYNSEELEPASGPVLIDFLITVGSGVAARAIYDALNGREETEDLNVDVDVSEVSGTDIEINIDK